MNKYLFAYEPIGSHGFVGCNVVAIRNGTDSRDRTYRRGCRGKIFSLDPDLTIVCTNGLHIVKPNIYRWRAVVPRGGAWWFIDGDLVVASSVGEAISYYRKLELRSGEELKAFFENGGPKSATMTEILTPGPDDDGLTVGEIFANWNPERGPWHLIDLIK